MAHAHLLNVVVFNPPLELHLKLLLEVVSLQIINDADLIAPFLIATQVEVTGQEIRVISNLRESKIFSRLSAILVDGRLVDRLDHIVILLRVTMLLSDRQVHSIKQIAGLSLGILYHVNLLVFFDLANRQQERVVNEAHVLHELCILGHVVRDLAPVFVVEVYELFQIFQTQEVEIF